MALSRPLTPSAFFRVWVKQQRGAQIAQNLICSKQTNDIKSNPDNDTVFLNKNYNIVTGQKPEDSKGLVTAEKFLLILFLSKKVSLPYMEVYGDDSDGREQACTGLEE